MQNNRSISLFFNNFLDKIRKPQFAKIDLKDSKTFSQGLWMWVLLFLGYMFFCSNWLIMGKLEGEGANTESGWVGKILGTNASSNQVVIESVNYAVTFVRGLVTIIAGLIISKLTHKYSVLLALCLVTAALPLCLMPHIVPLVIGRMIMAFGGTLIIIYIQPVIVKWFTQEQKGVLSMLNGLAYSFGALLINIVFLDNSVKLTLLKNWQIVAIVFALLTYVPFFLYIWKGINFETENPSLDISKENSKELRVDTYSGIIKEKSMWMWIFFYSFLIVISLMTSGFLGKIVKNCFENVYKVTGDASDGYDWGSLYTVIFYLGCASGMILGFFNKVKVQKTKLVQLFALIALIAWLFIAFSLILFSKISPIFVTVVCFIFVFVVSFFGMGLQSVALYIPHLYKGNSTKRITIFYSLLWGIGYLLFTVYSIIASAILGQSKNSSELSEGKTNQEIIGFILILLITLFLCAYWLISMYIEEPNPDLPSKLTFSMIKEAFTFESISNKNSEFEKASENTQIQEAIVEEIQISENQTEVIEEYVSVVEEVKVEPEVVKTKPEKAQDKKTNKGSKT